MDSLMAVRIRNATQQDFGVEPPVALLLDGASLNDIAANVMSQLGHGPARHHRRRRSQQRPTSVPLRAKVHQCGDREDYARETKPAHRMLWPANAIAVIGMAARLPWRQFVCRSSEETTCGAARNQSSRYVRGPAGGRRGHPGVPGESVVRPSRAAGRPGSTNSTPNSSECHRRRPG